MDMKANFPPGLWTPGTPRIPESLYEMAAKLVGKYIEKE